LKDHHFQKIPLKDRRYAKYHGNNDSVPKIPFRYFCNQPVIMVGGPFGFWAGETF